MKRLGDIFNTKPEPTLDPSKSRLPSITGDVRFEHVRFRYAPDSPEVIRDVSFGIRPGTVVGVVGRSGSGKSTISKLLQRLYVPESGKILIDGAILLLPIRAGCAGKSVWFCRKTFCLMPACETILRYMRQVVVRTTS